MNAYKILILLIKSWKQSNELKDAKACEAEEASVLESSSQCIHSEFFTPILYLFFAFGVRFPKNHDEAPLTSGFIHQAIQKNDLALIRLIAKYDIDAFEKYDLKKTLLHCVGYSAIDILNYLKQLEIFKNVSENNYLSLGRKLCTDLTRQSIYEFLNGTRSGLMLNHFLDLSFDQLLDQFVAVGGDFNEYDLHGNMLAYAANEVVNASGAKRMSELLIMMHQLLNHGAHPKNDDEDSLRRVQLSSSSPLTKDLLALIQRMSWQVR